MIGKENSKLWTKDFTIITIGSAISMCGNTMAGFAMSLLVLDYTNSSFLYAIYLMMWSLPQLVTPILSGAFLDRFSRKKMIYTLDFAAATMYLLVGFIMKSGWFSFPIFALIVFLDGAIQSFYQVAYDSFYPMLISEGNYSKAYSIASVLESATMIMVPIATALYNLVGIVPLLFMNAFSFFLAACFETRITAEEAYIDLQKSHATEEGHYGKQMLLDIKEGFQYLWSEKGLLYITLFVMMMSFSYGTLEVLLLPYFKSTYSNGEYLFILVYGCSVVSRMVGGGIHYKKTLPIDKKYNIALILYIAIAVMDGTYLYFPIVVMMIANFLDGIFGITTYTIRISATQGYVPDEKKGRYNGAVIVLNTMGSLLGEGISGFLGELVPTRPLITCIMAFYALSAVWLIGCHKKEVMPLYNCQN